VTTEEGACPERGHGPRTITPATRTATSGILPLGGIPFIHEHKLITRRLREALELIDVRVLDHLIVAGGDVTSLVERGLI
jgi:DNA repair protein RadC